MPHTNSGTPVFIQVAAARAFDVGPEVRGVGQVEVGTKTVFNPSVLAVDFNNAGAAGSRTRDLAVAKEFVNDRCAEIDPENRGIYTQSDSPKKSSRNIWSLAVVSVDQRY